MPVRYHARKNGTLTADDVCQDDARDERPDSPLLLACERCGRRAASTVAEARSRTFGWRVALFCSTCELWWHSHA